MTVTLLEKLYKIDDVVPQSGQYLCVPCGYVQYFNEGNLFTTCDACLAGTADGPEGYKQDEADFWQLIIE